MERCKASLAYAKDSQGKFYHNFGPLNRNGGERRLNVAITRAKDNVQLVASIHHTDINLANSRAEGVRLLRAYLDYAQNGEDALDRDLVISKEDEYDSDFELEVCEYLRDNGFTVDTQVGCSGYKIDLAIRRPDSSDYFLAVECDGATYHRFKNARDRDRLRQEILERMGWKFYRIWSTDWYKNKVIEKTNLLKAVKEASINIPETKTNTLPVSSDLQSIQDPFSSIIEKTSSAFNCYTQLNAMQILEDHNYNILTSLQYILEKETPLSEEWFLKRIISYFGREKITNVVLSQFEPIIGRCQEYGITRKNGFLYLNGKNKNELRIPGDKREIKYISIDELAAGFYTFIQQSVSVNRSGLYKSMTNILGFNRTGDNIIARYDECIKFLEDCGMIQIDNDTISLVKKS